MWPFSRTDLVLLHPPSVYDFRDHPIMFGPISDVIPSTAIFEMYPVGFTAMAEYLGRSGFRVRIINLALRMLKSPSYNPEAVIKALRPLAFGIDLHWLPHVQGSLKVASICKKHHPGIPVIMGGFSSSYFFMELLQRPEVDYVLRGDSTEEPLRMLMEAISQGRTKDLSHVPNLAWRTRHGKIVGNPISHLPQVLDHYVDNYGSMMRSAIRYLDIKSMLPIHDWWSYPITAVMTCRGCVHSCSFCGGSRYGLRIFGQRSKPAFRPPDLVVQDIRKISGFTSAPIFVVGDLRQAGEDYARQVLEGLEPLRVPNQVVIELFGKAPLSYFKKLAQAVPNFNLEMSPESHELEVRAASGKHYTNQELEETIQAALDAGCRKFDLFFMIGLPKQTFESVLATVDYCEALLKRFGPRLVPFISPLAPFIDPASPIFEEPERFGYKLFFKTLEEFEKALLQPSWKYALSYETKWMSRDQIVEATYEAALRLNRIKARFGLLELPTSRKVEERILLARRLIKQIDECLLLPEAQRRKALDRMKQEIQEANSDTLCEAREIQWPSPKNFHFMGIAKNLLRRSGK
jgi:B12-binding domain/radical SAM domain protein